MAFSALDTVSQAAALDIFTLHLLESTNCYFSRKQSTITNYLCLSQINLHSYPGWRQEVYLLASRQVLQYAKKSEWYFHEGNVS